MAQIQTFDSVDAYLASFPPPSRPYTPEERKRVDERYGELRKLEKQAKANIGQLVLVVSRYIEHPGGCIVGSPRVIEQFRLGILSAPGILLRKSKKFLKWNIAVITKHHVAYGKIVPGPISDEGLVLVSFLLCLNVPLKESYYVIKKRKKLEVVIGEKAIHAWAVEWRQEEAIQDMTKLLGYTLDFPTLTQRRLDERDQLARSIEAAWVQSQVLACRIAAIQQAGREGGTTSDDDFWLTLGDREKLGRQDGDLVRTLKRLLELGVDDATPNIHLIRHIAHHFTIRIP